MSLFSFRVWGCIAIKFNSTFRSEDPNKTHCSHYVLFDLLWMVNALGLVKDSISLLFAWQTSGPVILIDAWGN
ncbi:hypothetical protein BpHYR1_023799 [Brachionus plicatilis]|uniref:Uncharacterized protein n=1 Tax=Brachionus plicatilis TaxID=10195 RepID=A0A3M7QIM0_BRAPC|nr:hypothetical protein BpHYR1_023799 [Brachionus plicatilis]